MGREGDQAVLEDHALDARKAAVWSVIAGLAHLGVVRIGNVAYPNLRNGLIAIAFGLMLPAIAVLHTRHRGVRESGAVLATIAGTSVVVIGLGGVVNVDLQPAAIFLLGVWWWTMGKMWRETGVLPDAMGRSTVVAGMVALAFGPIAALVAPLQIVVPAMAATPVWPTMEAFLGVWLIALAAALWRRADVPSR